MFSVIIIIGLVVLTIFILIMIVKHHLFIKNLVNAFCSCNVIVAGKKGTGKDLLFNYIIHKRKDVYYSNIPYDDVNYHNVSLLDVSTMPNDYNNIVNGTIEKQPHKFIEGKDIYISDIGVFLPSYMDSTLYKKFPSMPVFYALSRHLYDCNVHCNTQNIERGWKALREQADYYCVVRGTTRFLGFLITKVYCYDKYESARQNLEPLKARMFNKYSKSEVDLYYATNGDIRTGHVIQRIKKITYDTRAFEKILLEGVRLYENDK